MSQLQSSGLGYKLFQAGLYITMAVGAGMVAFPSLTLQFFGLMNFQDAAAMLAWPVEAQQYAKLAHAVMGSVMIGWAVLMLWVTKVVLPQFGPIALKAIAWSIMLWYVPDTVASVLHGFWQNAVFNTGFLLMLTLPLIMIHSGQIVDADFASDHD